jgi:hypothetical protein
MLTCIVKMLQNSIASILLHKVGAHAKVARNEEADKLAKSGNKLKHLDQVEQYEWLSMPRHPYKDSIRFLKAMLDKQEKKENLPVATANFQSISLWKDDTFIDNISSNNLWENPTIFDAQITQLLKFQYNQYKQYIGNARKQLFFGLEQYSNITCPICPTIQPNTWLYILLYCTEPHIHTLRTNRHNKIVQIIRKFLVTLSKSRCYTLMNGNSKKTLYLNGYYHAIVSIQYKDAN